MRATTPAVGVETILADLKLDAPCERKLRDGQRK